jgi:hypothetical protein
MKSLSAAALPLPALQNSVTLKLLAAAIMASFADWLFYGYRPGISVAIFLLVLAGISLVTNPIPVNHRRVWISALILVAGLAPIVEHLEFLSAAFAIIATAIAVSSVTNPFIETLGDRLNAAGQILFSGPFRLLADLTDMKSRSLSLTQISVWIVPLVLGAIFLFLFSAANPLIERWFALIDLGALFAALDALRILLWTAILVAIWPFISAKWKGKKPVERNDGEVTPPPKLVATAPNAIFGAAAILRSLVLFNLLFAIETVLDLIYLWGGVALPDGMTYASYAHRGAYPLMATALLAAVFVLAAMRPGGPAERIPLIRMLVFLFVAQNVMLVVSSILRLDLYVEIYSLTYWRVAAFIWMVLVALGLVLIVVRIALNLGNRWLVLANLSTLTLALYICTFVNFPLLIADYNVSHSKEVSGKGVPLDLHYLVSLGPQVLPAIDRYRDHPNRAEVYSAIPGPYGAKLPMIDNLRNGLVNKQRSELDSWRGWSFRGWRLQQYLDRISANSRVSSYSMMPSFRRPA